MKSGLSILLATVMFGTAAIAGGPVVVVEDEEDVVAEKPASSVGLLPLLLIPVALCLVLCSDDEDLPPT